MWKSILSDTLVLPLTSDTGSSPFAVIHWVAFCCSFVSTTSAAGVYFAVPPNDCHGTVRNFPLLMEKSAATFGASFVPVTTALALAAPVNCGGRERVALRARRMQLF